MGVRGASSAVLGMLLAVLALPSVAAAQDCCRTGCTSAERDEGTGCCPESSCTAGARSVRPREPTERRPRAARATSFDYPCAVGTDPVEIAAASAWREAETQLVAHEDVRIDPGTPPTLQAYVERIREQHTASVRQAEAIAAAFDRVRAFDRACWSIAADARAGRAYEVSARELLNTPFAMPRDLERRIRGASAEVREEVRVQVEDRLRQQIDALLGPTECAATARYLRSWRAARDARAAYDASITVDGRLAAYGPERIVECMAGTSMPPPTAEERPLVGSMPRTTLDELTAFDTPTPYVTRSEGVSAAARASFDRGVAALVARDWETARAQLALAAGAQPELLAARIDLALLDARSGAHLAALTSLSAMPLSDPRVASALAFVASTSLPAEDALARLRTHSEPPVRIELARLLVSLGRAEEAVRALAGVETDEARLMRARAQLALGRLDDGASTLAALSGAEAALLVAELEQARERPVESTASLRRAQSAAPRVASVATALALRLVDAHRPAEALAVADQALAAEPLSAPLLLARARALSALGRSPEALAAAAAAVDIDGTLAPAFFTRAAATAPVLTATGTTEGLARLERARADMQAFAAATRGATARLRETGMTFTEELQRAVERERRAIERDAARRAREASRAGGSH